MSNQHDDVIERHDVGPHRVEIERMAIMHIRYQGDVALEHFIAFDAIIERLTAENWIYLLRDGRHGGFALPEARTYMARRAHVSRLLAIVTYGTSFRGKTLVRMTHTAIRVLKHEGPELAFLETEAEAREWIAEHRRRMSEEGPRSR